ncbi:MAG: BACON domain-containing protein [Alistipes sp.]|nr:BACON domain-containing protein [Alistipes sp.]
MKKLLIFMALSVAALAMSCTTDDGDATTGTLSLTSEGVMRFAQDGGDGVINYTLQGAKSGAKVDAVCMSEWVTITEVANDIKFTVAANDLSEERTALILVTYGKQSEQVIVEQQGAPNVEFMASMLNGSFEKKDASHPDAYRYTVVLSKYGTTRDTDYYADDCYYKFYIYSSVPAMSDPYLPEGEYLFDAQSTYAVNTFAEDLSEYVAVDKEGNATATKIKGGKVVVSNNKIEALITLANDEVHSVQYNGSLNLNYLITVEKGPYSTLVQDYEFDLQSGAMILAYYGDEYMVGRGSWDIFFMEQAGGANGDFFRFSVIVDTVELDRKHIFRTFTADKMSTFAAGTFTPGYKYNGNNIGAWYILAENGYYTSTYACIVDGSITIEPDGDDIVVTADVIDDNGKRITGTCRCIYIEEYNRVGL